MRVLIVGTGTMGARHLQAMALLPDTATILALEPNTDARHKAAAMWREMPHHQRHTLQFVEPKDLPLDGLDAAILATTAGGRLELLRLLAETEVKVVLCEKVLFQSIADYHAARTLTQSVGMDVRAHLPLRYLKHIRALRRLYRGKPLRMIVRVGDRGLGCNGIHYIDLFQFIAGSEIVSIDAAINPPLQKNRRDPSLVEFSGKVSAVAHSSAVLDLVFRQGDDHLPMLAVEEGDHRTVLRLGKGEGMNRPLRTGELYACMPMASTMSHILVLDMLQNRSLLPSLAEGENYNVLMLEAYNRALGRTADDFCPIT